jgi:hypothetical protein
MPFKKWQEPFYLSIPHMCHLELTFNVMIFFRLFLAYTIRWSIKIGIGICFSNEFELFPYSLSIKSIWGYAQWLTLIIPPTWEMRSGGLWFKASLGWEWKGCYWDPISTNKLGSGDTCLWSQLLGGWGSRIAVWACPRQKFETLSEK